MSNVIYEMSNVKCGKCDSRKVCTIANQPHKRCGATVVRTLSPRHVTHIKHHKESEKWLNSERNMETS